QAAEDLIKNAVQNAVNAQPTPQQPARDIPQPVQQTQTDPDDYWNTIPQEENLFTFQGPYFLYFEKIFTESFSMFRIEREAAKGRKAVIFTFWDGARKALCVEILDGNSNAKRFREECQAAGIPYLRFYYNHWGWWNTRSYVENRVRGALDG
ncbi:MAG: hypothetical protein IK130_03780, partial [Oscillospiraceae bacterium]|nr:hypothetical protein [Oscillospiraceae bacterium]